MNKNKHFILSMAALLAWLIIIFTLSHQNGADTYETSSGLAMLIQRYLPAASFEVIHMTLRKAAHVMLFAILAILACVAANVAEQRLHSVLRHILYICPFFLSWFDEYTKIFVNGRHYELKDVALNIIGCIAGVIILQLARAIRK